MAPYTTRKPTTKKVPDPQYILPSGDYTATQQQTSFSDQTHPFILRCRRPHDYEGWTPDPMTMDDRMDVDPVVPEAKQRYNFNILGAAKSGAQPFGSNSFGTAAAGDVAGVAAPAPVPMEIDSVQAPTGSGDPTGSRKRRDKKTGRDWSLKAWRRRRDEYEAKTLRKKAMELLAVNKVRFSGRQLTPADVAEKLAFLSQINFSNNMAENSSNVLTLSQECKVRKVAYTVRRGDASDSIEAIYN
ncbi:hypothetical protein B0T26DRAFT_786502 [Lasiosphaeria miniovina]|uniref:Uncharacterized protein n=1 Tax=Lasiosphaeria miniovina TaxID=1954250 RepID=A0AA40DN36_9PEZI|nr:uncharacterized protein B0T26DRAFT_786502 [Lasiosphaeria miniovina]KAK0709804.1 hypothetical protein B0T26DRAFT_786502 [Lasiosphaeria miniovina]